jgi:hypothetical protein
MRNRILSKKEHYRPTTVFGGIVIRFALLSVLAVVSTQVDAQTDEDFIEVKKIWNEFADGIIQKDFNGLRHISSDTIFCPCCAENTLEEQVVMNRIRATNAYPDTLYTYMAKIPFDKFYQEELFSICDSMVIEKLTDTAKIRYSRNDHVHGKRNYYEVHITVVESVRGEQGYLDGGCSYDFHFKRTDKGLRFCSFSTTP